MVSRAPRIAFAIALLAALAAATQTFAKDHDGRDWPTIGHYTSNPRDQPFEHTIKPKNVHRLLPKWIATTTGDVSATPAVVDGAVYFGDFGGTVWKLDADTGGVIWSHSVPAYTGHAGDYARTSPSLAGNVLVMGIIHGSTSPNGQVNMLGINATDGSLIWSKTIEDDSHAAMTGSPNLVGDTVITGVSANNASMGAASTFRGSIVALNAQMGDILWKTYSLPSTSDATGHYAGGTMFAPPAVDVGNGLVIGMFGQTYTTPGSVAACHAAHGGYDESCEWPGAYWKSIVAFNLTTGAPVWSYRVYGPVPRDRACADQPPTVTWCHPYTEGGQWDLGGSGANVFTLGHGKKARDVIGVGGKSGVYYLLDAKTGTLIWNTLIGPGADQGGMEWGTAYDGDRIYVSITNQNHEPYRLTPSGEAVTGGSWAALDPETGKILWQTGDPVGAYDLAPVTSANGVVYASSMPQTGYQMYALDAKTGEILWRWAAGSSVNSGPSVVDGTVYWGSGYDRRLGGNGNNKLFAFSIDGKSKHDKDEGD
jgi:polyvinyl alcohol dehydrogenase (cytochrome)